MSGLEHVQIDRFQYDYDDRGNYGQVIVRAGVPKLTRVVPPAGKDNAFTYADYPARVEVSISPTGRSVQVWVNGNKVHP